MKRELFVSVCILLRKELDAAYISELSILHTFLNNNYTDFEIVLFDAGKSCRSEFLVRPVITSLTCTRYLKTVRSLEDDVAIAVLLENAIGDIVVNYDPYFDGLSALERGIDLISSGNDVVIGVAKANASISYKMIRPFMGLLLAEVGLNMPKSSTYLWFFSRSAISAITASAKYYHSIQSKIVFSGFNLVPMPYESLYVRVKNTSDSVKLVIRQVVYSSTKPLLWMSFMGLVGSFLAFVISVYSVLIKIFKSQSPEGWTTLVLVTSFLFIFLFLMLSIFGQYLGRLLNDQSEGKDFAFSLEMSSPTMLNPFRANVLQRD